MAVLQSFIISLPAAFSPIVDFQFLHPVAQSAGVDAQKLSGTVRAIYSSLGDVHHPVDVVGDGLIEIVRIWWCDRGRGC